MPEFGSVAGAEGVHVAARYAARLLRDIAGREGEHIAADRRCHISILVQITEEILLPEQRPGSGVDGEVGGIRDDIDHAVLKGDPGASVVKRIGPDFGTSIGIDPIQITDGSTGAIQRIRASSIIEHITGAQEKTASILRVLPDLLPCSSVDRLQVAAGGLIVLKKQPVAQEQECVRLGVREAPGDMLGVRKVITTDGSLLSCVKRTEGRTWQRRRGCRYNSRRRGRRPGRAGAPAWPDREG